MIFCSSEENLKDFPFSWKLSGGKAFLFYSPTKKSALLLQPESDQEREDLFNQRSYFMQNTISVRQTNANEKAKPQQGKKTVEDGKD